MTAEQLDLFRNQPPAEPEPEKKWPRKGEQLTELPGTTFEDIFKEGS